MEASAVRSLAGLFLWRTRSTPDLSAYLYPTPSGWQELSWGQTEERVRAVACGLLDLGLEPEDRCGILASTRVEWILADFGVLCAGGATTTVYPSCTAEETGFILADSGSRFVFVENQEQLDKILAVKDELPRLEGIITFEATTAEDDRVLSFEGLLERGRLRDREHPGRFEEGVAAVSPDQLATLIYTSGTTGKPKGVELTHDAWVFEAEAIDELKMYGPDDVSFLWLPLSHSFGKVLQASQLKVGVVSAIDGRVDRILENLAAIRPTLMAAAPRIFEKIYNRVVTRAKAAGGMRYRIFRWALGVGHERSRLEREGRTIGPWLGLEVRLADRLVFSRIRGIFGGRIRFFTSGSAPLSREIAEFFHAVGVLILEGYGLTESGAASFVNRLDAYSFGTVGLAVPGVGVRIAEDGEILLGGRGLMRGYHGRPDLTAEVLEHGWLRTGDIGVLEDGGFLRITDRKKDLIKTSGGKYVAPQMLEGRLKSLCPYVSHVLVHGNRRNFVSALVTLDPDAIGRWADQNDLGETEPGRLARRPEVVALVQDAVDALNAGVARYETIKKFAIVERDFSVETGELTPSMKVKRRVVEDRYAAVLDSFYESLVTEP